MNRITQQQKYEREIRLAARILLHQIMKDCVKASVTMLKETGISRKEALELLAEVLNDTKGAVLQAAEEVQNAND